MITLHHLNNSRSQRILWLLEELELPYELVRYQRHPKTMLAPPTLAEVHPLGKSPAIVDDGFVITESGAIIDYILEKYDTDFLFFSKNFEERTKARIWLHYAEGSLMPILLLLLVADRIEGSPMPFFAEPIAKKISEAIHKNYLDHNLDQNIRYLYENIRSTPYFLGDRLTAADFAMIFPLETIVSRGLLDTYPTDWQNRFSDYVESIQSRPAYQRTLERGGPYNYLLTPNKEEKNETK